MTREEKDRTGKRLGFIVPNMAGGGAERIILVLIDAALAAGHDVDLVLQTRTGELLDLLPPQVRIIDLNAARFRNTFSPLVRYFRDCRPDGVQVSMWPLTVLAVAAHRAARSGARLVLSDHVDFSGYFTPSQRMARGALIASVRLAYPRADARILVSIGAADGMARLTGIARRSLEVIYNPIAEPARPPAPDPAIEALWGAPTGRILTVGKLKAQKNHALLIRGFARLLQRRPAKLMILGEGELRPELEALIAALGVGDHVVLAGFTNDPGPYYASADLFALSSDYEGFGNVIVEAMYCGVPVVSTDCPSGPREILDGGRFGTLVPPNDEAALTAALEAALDAPADTARLIARARDLSGPGTSARYLELMLGEKPSTAGDPAR